MQNEISVFADMKAEPLSVLNTVFDCNELYDSLVMYVVTRVDCKRVEVCKADENYVMTILSDGNAINGSVEDAEIFFANEGDDCEGLVYITPDKLKIAAMLTEIQLSAAMF